MKFHRLAWLALAAVACTPEATDPKDENPKDLGELLSRGAYQETHADCPTGATVFEAGHDTDGDGALSRAEVDSTAVVCVGGEACDVDTQATEVVVTCADHPAVHVPREPGTVVTVRVGDEECDHGGSVVDYGLDNGEGGGIARDGILQDGEIDSSTPICDAEILSDSEYREVQPNCDVGATVFTAGRDADGDGVLDGDEVESTVVLCQNGDECQVSTSSTEHVITCGEHPSVHVPIAPELLVQVSTISPGPTCLAGGVFLASGLDDGEDDGEPGDEILHEDEIDDSQELCEAYCGDGTKDHFEGCDDRNRLDGDGCDSGCRVEPNCLPPEPDEGCPDVQYFVDSIVQPSSRPLSGGFTVTLTGVFPSNGAAYPVVVTRLADSEEFYATFVNENQIRFTAESGLGTPEISVQVSDITIPVLTKSVFSDGTFVIGYAPTMSYAYDAPLLQALESCTMGSDPLRVHDCAVAGNEPLTISGLNFARTVDDAQHIKVSVGGATCSSVTLAALDELTCSSPAGYGAAEVVVTVGGQPSSNVGHYDYTMPEVTAVMPEVLSSTTGGVIITIIGRNFDSGTGATQATLVAHGQRLPCTLQTVSPTEILCSAPPGVGSNYAIEVFDGFVASRLSTDTISYPAPDLEPDTLRLAIGDPDGGTVVLNPMSGSEIFFDATHVGTNPALLQVRVGPYLCYDVMLHGNGDEVTVSCTVSGGDAAGSPYSVTLHALDQSAEGAGLAYFAMAPTISSVTGCPNDRCPTEGGLPITIYGENFTTSDNFVFVGSAQCPLRSVSVGAGVPDQAVCLLPEGVGQAAVRFFGAGIGSNAGSLSYAAPSITAVSGCGDFDHTTLACPRTGGVPITIEGMNFGAQGAMVLVGSNECTGVTPSAVSPHRQLVCTLPEGMGQNQPVRVINGFSSQGFSISYE